MTNIIFTVRGLPVSPSGVSNGDSNSYCSTVSSVVYPTGRETRPVES